VSPDDVLVAVSVPDVYMPDRTITDERFEAWVNQAVIETMEDACRSEGRMRAGPIRYLGRSRAILADSDGKVVVSAFGDREWMLQFAAITVPEFGTDQ
jgi:hypothetical protein